MVFTITQEKVTGLNHFYEVTVTAGVIQSHVDHELKRIQATAQVPGFRKGKVPNDILRKRYGESLLSDAINHAVNDAINQLFKQKDIRPALSPDTNVLSFEEGKDLVFSVELEVYPVTPDVDCESLKLERIVVDVDDAEIAKGMDRLAEWGKRAQTVEDSSYKAENSDELTIDFVGKIDGVAFEGGTAEGAKLVLGSGTFIPGFEEQLVGTKVGDSVVVKVSFPENYHGKDLAGKAAEFDVTVHSIAQMKAPAVDEEFAKNQGFDSLDALKEQIRKVIEGDYLKISRAKMKRELFDLLDQGYAFEVPGKMVEMEFDSLWKRIQEEAKNDPEMAAKPENELRDEYQKMAERRVRLGILLSDTGRKQSIEVTESDLHHAIVEQLKTYQGNPQMVIDYYRNNPNAKEYLKGPILEEKVVDFMLDRAAITDKKVSADDVVKMLESGEVVVG